jgi:hypothetical protein
VATHLGKRFFDGERIHPLFEERIRLLAKRPGWFTPVGPLLDFLRVQRRDVFLPKREWRRMQWRWLTDTALRVARRELRRRGWRRLAR